MSVNVNVFRPSYDGVSVQSSGTIVVKLGNEGGEINLFFQQASASAAELLGYDSSIPAVQVANLVSNILAGAGFDAYEFEKVDGLVYHGQPVCEAFFDHPSFEGPATEQVPPCSWLADHLDPVTL